MALQNQSFRLRSTGNEFYQKSLKQGLAPILQQSYLKDALPCYQRALTAASPNENDMMASACKNLAKTNYKLFQLVDTEKKEQYHLRECFHYYSKASEHGRNCMTMEWLADIDTQQRLLFEETLERFEFLKSKEKIVSSSLKVLLLWSQNPVLCIRILIMFWQRSGWIKHVWHWTIKTSGRAFTHSKRCIDQSKRWNAMDSIALICWELLNALRKILWFKQRVLNHFNQCTQVRAWMQYSYMTCFLLAA